MRPIYPGMKARMSDGSTATVTDVLIDRHDPTPRVLVLSANGYFGPDVLAPFAARPVGPTVAYGAMTTAGPGRAPCPLAARLWHGPALRTLARLAPPSSPAQW